MLIPKEIHRIIMSRISRDRLELPSMPTVSAALQGLVKGTTFVASDYVRVLERDPLTVATLLQHGISATPGLQIDTIEQGVNAVGQRGMKPFVVEVHSRPAQSSRDARLDAVYRTLVNHTLAVARLGRDVAGILGHPDPEAAYLIGLLHDLGKLVYGAYLLEAERSMAVGSITWLDPVAWEGAVSTYQREIGVQVAERWGFPRHLVTFIADPLEYNAGDRQSPVNAACYANALVKSRGLYEKTVDEMDNRAVLMLGRNLLGVDEEIVGRLTTNIVTPLSTTAPEPRAPARRPSSAAV